MQQLLDNSSISRSFLCFSVAKSQESKWQQLKKKIQLNVVSRHEMYLGLPSMVARKKTSFFNELKLRVLNKVSS